MGSYRISRLVGLTLGVWLLASLSPAAGSTSRPRAAAQYGVSIQAVFDSGGDPLLVANFDPDGSLATPTFSICPPGKPCKSRQEGQNGLRPGPEPTGTRFTAQATYRGETYSASVSWLGQVQTLGSPRLLGAARQGRIVRPVAARWQGGWGGKSDLLGVQACRTMSGRDCRMLGGGELGCPDASSLSARWMVRRLVRVCARRP